MATEKIYIFKKSTFSTLQVKCMYIQKYTLIFDCADIYGSTIDNQYLVNRIKYSQNSIKWPPLENKVVT